MNCKKTMVIGKGFGMKKNIRKFSKQGFTLVELLTVMAIIAILISLLVPALNLVRDYADVIKQEAQFHSIDVALGMYKNAFGDYPESTDNTDLYTVAPLNTAYCGANKLAEALVGWDLLGLHPQSQYRADGLSNSLWDPTIPGVATDWVYAPVVGNVSDPSVGFAAGGENNVKARKGPYLEVENANAFMMQEIYGLAGIAPFVTATTKQNQTFSNYVLCDDFEKIRTNSGQKTGMPILYYKSRYPVYTQQYVTDNSGVYIGNNDIYCYQDNSQLVTMNIPFGAAGQLHPLGDGTTDELDFENMILDTTIFAVPRPHKVDSYILISAGKDGQYGTGDDILNFKKEE